MKREGDSKRNRREGEREREEGSERERRPLTSRAMVWINFSTEMRPSTSCGEIAHPVGVTDPAPSCLRPRVVLP